MNDSKPQTTAGTDWTRLLTDPDLVQHLEALLQTYREAAPDKREEALLAAMREIKSQPATESVSLGDSSAHPDSDAAAGSVHATL